MFQPEKWQGFQQLKLENEAIRIIVMPELGGKIASILDKSTDHEWLIQPSVTQVQRSEYAGDYVAADPNSWDEMIPTIVPCPYPGADQFEGVALPDHGEVWALEWAIEAADAKQISLSIQGKALPYRLQRTIQLVSTDRVKIDYRVTNVGDHSFYFLWASHALFAVDDQTRLELPSHINRLYNVHDVDAWGPHGTIYDYPEATDSDGQIWDLSRMSFSDPITCRKFNLHPEDRAEYVGLFQSDKRAKVTMSWDSTELPYLGLWIDEGVYTKEATIGLEPSNAFYDSLQVAFENNRVPLLHAGETTAWHLNLTFGQSSIAT